MSSAVSYPHLETDASGVVRVAGSRYKVLHLAGEHYHYGWTAEELLRQHPDLRPEEIYAALAYFYDHYESIVKQLQESGDRSRASSTASPLTREELLQRKKLLEAS
jgi:uncharacterized protein (DUF433 family)